MPSRGLYVAFLDPMPRPETRGEHAVRLTAERGPQRTGRVVIVDESTEGAPPHRSIHFLSTSRGRTPPLPQTPCHD